MVNSTNLSLSGDLKQQIADDLRNYVQNMAGGSGNKASKMLKNVSNGYISLMLNGKWDAISDEAWRNVQKQVSSNGEWQFVETKSSNMLFHLLNDSRQHAICLGVTAMEGRGKTFPTEIFAKQNQNIFVIRCNEFDTRKTFLQELLSVMGIQPAGHSVADMMRTVVSHIRRLDNPVIIWDEGDKPSDSILYFFITFFNMLEDKCGLILMATPFLETRIEKGVRLNKKGFREIYSRLGRKFIQLPEHSPAEIANIIRANGIGEDIKINEIINKSEGDLRRVKKLVHAIKRKEATK